MSRKLLPRRFFFFASSTECALKDAAARSSTNEHGQAIQIGSAAAARAGVLFSQLPVPADASDLFHGSRKAPRTRQNVVNTLSEIKAGYQRLDHQT